MCLAVPVRIVELLTDERAKVVLGGTETIISVALLDELRVGDFVVTHTGVALCRLRTEEAEQTLRYLTELAGRAVDPDDR
jgi:hydrogenase expression/formation protein HypC